MGAVQFNCNTSVKHYYKFHIVILDFDLLKLHLLKQIVQFQIFERLTHAS